MTEPPDAVAVIAMKLNTNRQTAVRWALDCTSDGGRAWAGLQLEMPPRLCGPSPEARKAVAAEIVAAAERLCLRAL